MRQKFFDIAFATGGDQTVIPDAVDPGGDVSFNQGYGPDFQIDPTVDATGKDIDRMKFNYLMNAVTGALQALQEGGIPEWITAANNGGVAFPYAAQAHVLYSASGNPPFVEYVSLIANNTDTPGTTANWQVFLGIESSAAQALAGVDATTTMTPRRVASAINTAVTPFGNHTGSIVFFAQTAAPAGFIPANGALVSRVTFAALFAAIGTTFGAGDGATTFSVPDMRGCFPRGFDNGRGIDPARVFGSTQTSQNASHTHATSDPGHNHAVSQSAHAHPTGDPGHVHGVGDPGHAHAVADPSHIHGIGDPGHAHSMPNLGSVQAGGDNGGAQSPVATGFTSSRGQQNVNVSGTGIFMGAALTGIGIFAAGTGIFLGAALTGFVVGAQVANVANVAAVTGLSIVATGGTEARPTNVALLACIKF